MSPKAVAVFNTRSVKGTVLFSNRKNGLYIQAEFTQLPKGLHGFHIHKAGDLRGEGCKLACDHYHKGVPSSHGGPPNTKGPRHTGDLGNVTEGKYTYTLHDVSVEDILGFAQLKAGKFIKIIQKFNIKRAIDEIISIQ
jgi:Cu-Zn family superoxide dismutase